MERGGTWIQHAKDVMNHILSVNEEIWTFTPLTKSVQVDGKLRKEMVLAYRQKVVMPRARAKELRWFNEALAALNNEGYINYAELVPVRKLWKPSMKWAGWGHCMWRFFRAWCVCRITGGVPLAVWGAGRVVMFLPICPGCGATLVGLKHILQDCNELARHRDGLPLAARGRETMWALAGDAHVETLRHKVRYVGVCMAQLTQRLAEHRWDRT